MMNFAEQKKEALSAYKAAKENYLSDPKKENWIEFCNRKTVCMKLGVRI